MSIEILKETGALLEGHFLLSSGRHSDRYAQNAKSVSYTHLDVYKRQVAQFMGFLKSKSALMIFDRHANLKYKYGRRNFWSRGYFVDTVGKNERVIQEYIKNQLERDYVQDQVSLKEYIDPFTGNKCK